MRTSHTPDHHHLYASTPQHYPPVRRSARHSHQYLPPGTPVAMSPPQYHSSSMPAHYALNLSPYPPAHTLSSEGTSGSGYLDSFPGINMPNVMQMSMDPAPMGMDLSILSAEEHHDLHMIEERTSPSGSPSHPTDRSEQKQRQRRAQSDDSIDTPPKAGGKKQRGRPRLDPKDENAADRRRTQIRLAQRAYRLRKETTISSLRTRVTELEGTIESMQNTFMELRASAQECIQKNDEVRMGEVVNTLTERFLALAKGALRSDGGESLGEEDHTDEHSRGGRSERPKSRDDEGPTSGGNTGKNMSPPTWGGYQLSYTRDSQHEQRYPDGPAGSTTRGMGEYENVGHDDRSFNAYIDQQVLDMDMYSSPPSLPMEMEHFCYSYQETSFSRRLHRACLESAYHLLTSPTASQEDIGRTFAYTFCYASKQDVLNTVTRLLRAGNNESLSPRDYPELVQIPSRPLDYYDDIYQAYEDKARLDMLGQSNSEIREEAHRQLTKMGIDNKFLRPIDVEKLLVERGIIMETMDSTGSDHSSSPGSSQDSEYLSPSNLSVDSATSTETLFTPATKSEDPNSGTAGMKMMQGVKLSVDFDVLVKELIRHGVCLGQYPGFKPNDVEDAIRIASRAPVPDMVY